MDRKLHALVTREVLTDTVRIDVRGSLNEESRPSLVRLITRVRSMGISSHILVDLSSAGLVESAALAGLRNVLNAMDGALVPENAGAGVSLVLSAMTDGALPAAGIAGESLVITDELADELFDEPAVDLDHGLAGSMGPQAAAGAEGQTIPAGDSMFGQPLAGFSDEELFTASDALFALLDNPAAFVGSDVLARYNDIGEEISRRNLLSGLDEPASEALCGTAGEALYEAAGEGQVAS